jgi:thioredoxin-like negative regulator of GroEL
MLEITDSTGPGFLKEDRNYLLMFYTDWCPRCPPLAEALEALEKNRNANFELLKINFDKNPEAVGLFNVTGVPFVFAIVQKNVVAGWGGWADPDVFEERINALFNPERTNPPDKA